MAERHRIVATCENGHSQELVVEVSDRGFALGLARLLDGTSDKYKFPPANDPESPIGKCHWPGCRRPFTCTVEDA